jgi:hypothetical protein
MTVPFLDLPRWQMSPLIAPRQAANPATGQQGPHLAASRVPGRPEEKSKI